MFLMIFSDHEVEWNFEMPLKWKISIQSYHRDKWYTIICPPLGRPNHKSKRPEETISERVRQLSIRVTTHSRYSVEWPTKTTRAIYNGACIINSNISDTDLNIKLHPPFILNGIQNGELGLNFNYMNKYY